MVTSYRVGGPPFFQQESFHDVRSGNDGYFWRAPSLVLSKIGNDGCLENIQKRNENVENNLFVAMKLFAKKLFVYNIKNYTRFVVIQQNGRVDSDVSIEHELLCAIFIHYRYLCFDLNLKTMENDISQSDLCTFDGHSMTVS